MKKNYFKEHGLYGGALGMLLVGYLWDKLAKKKPATPSKVD